MGVGWFSTLAVPPPTGSRGAFCELRASDRRMLDFYTKLGSFQTLPLAGPPQEVMALGTSWWTAVCLPGFRAVASNGGPCSPRGPWSTARGTQNPSIIFVKVVSFMQNIIEWLPGHALEQSIVRSQAHASHHMVRICTPLMVMFTLPNRKSLRTTGLDDDDP